MNHIPSGTEILFVNITHIKASLTDKPGNRVNDKGRSSINNSNCNTNRNNGDNNKLCILDKLILGRPVNLFQFTGGILEEFNRFLAVSFPCDELEIMDYNRLIRDTNGYTVNQLLTLISQNFTFECVKPGTPYKPEEKHTFGMYIDGRWYKLTAKEGTFDANNPVSQLDVSILQNNLIAPIFGITDPRTDKRIDFVGGIRGLTELEKRADTDMKIAFSMYPTTLEDLTDIADAGLIMPPKSTWFEPKLLSGLFIHELS